MFAIYNDKSACGAVIVVHGNNIAAYGSATRPVFVLTVETDVVSVTDASTQSVGGRP